MWNKAVREQFDELKLPELILNPYRAIRLDLRVSYIPIKGSVFCATFDYLNKNDVKVSGYGNSAEGEYTDRWDEIFSKFESIEHFKDLVQSEDFEILNITATHCELVPSFSYADIATKIDTKVQEGSCTYTWLVELLHQYENSVKYNTLKKVTDFSTDLAGKHDPELLKNFLVSKMTTCASYAKKDPTPQAIKAQVFENAST